MPVSEPNEMDDAALGIGDDDGAEDFSSVLSDPRFAKLLDAAVAQRMASLAPVASPGGSDAAFAAFLANIEKVIGARDEQRPGYFKPLTAEEMESRAHGKVEMEALIRRNKADNIWPCYLLSDTFMGPSAAGPILYSAGQQINWRGAPAECMAPQNDAAAEVYVAYKKWIGEAVSVKDLLAQAAAEARGGEVISDMAIVRTGAEDIQVIDAPIRDMTPKRILGTSGIETRGRAMPGQPGIVAQPKGPVFVGDAA